MKYKRRDADISNFKTDTFLVCKSLYTLRKDVFEWFGHLFSFEMGFQFLQNGFRASFGQIKTEPAPALGIRRYRRNTVRLCNALIQDYFVNLEDNALIRGLQKYVTSFLTLDILARNIKSKIEKNAKYKKYSTLSIEK